MANPNKTVAAARRRMGGFPERVRAPDPFMDWLANYARANPGPCPWKSVEEARAAYEAQSAAGPAGQQPVSS